MAFTERFIDSQWRRSDATPCHTVQVSAVPCRAPDEDDGAPHTVLGDYKFSLHNSALRELLLAGRRARLPLAPRSFTRSRGVRAPRCPGLLRPPSLRCPRRGFGLPVLGHAR